MKQKTLHIIFTALLLIAFGGCAQDDGGSNLGLLALAGGGSGTSTPDNTQNPPQNPPQNQTFKITYSSAYGSVPSSKTVPYNYALKASDLPNLSASGYTFNGWNKSVGYKVTGNITITASWTVAPAARQAWIFTKYGNSNVTNSYFTDATHFSFSYYQDGYPMTVTQNGDICTISYRGSTNSGIGIGSTDIPTSATLKSSSAGQKVYTWGGGSYTGTTKNGLIVSVNSQFSRTYTYPTSGIMYDRIINGVTNFPMPSTGRMITGAMTIDLKYEVKSYTDTTLVIKQTVTNQSPQEITLTKMNYPF